MNRAIISVTKNLICFGIIEIDNLKKLEIFHKNLNQVGLFSKNNKLIVIINAKLLIFL